MLKLTVHEKSETSYGTEFNLAYLIHCPFAWGTRATRGLHRDWFE